MYPEIPSEISRCDRVSCGDRYHESRLFELMESRRVMISVETQENYTRWISGFQRYGPCQRLAAENNRKPLKFHNFIWIRWGPGVMRGHIRCPENQGSRIEVPWADTSTSFASRSPATLQLRLSGSVQRCRKHSFQGPFCSLSFFRNKYLMICPFFKSSPRNIILS